MKHKVFARIRESIPKAYCFGIFYTVASVLFADEYTVNVPAWKGSPIPITVEYDISRLAPGHILELDYAGLPVWVYRRTDDEIKYIADNYSGATPEVLDEIVDQIIGNVTSVDRLSMARLQLLDQPELEKSPYRSKRKEYLVFEAIGRYGCTLQMETPHYAGTADDAKFYDPCIFGVYDLAGRSISGNTAGEHLRIPAHEYLANGVLSIGVSDLNVLPRLSLSEDSLFSGLTPTKLLLQATAFNDLNRAKAAIKAGADVNAPGILRKTTGSLPLLRAVLFSSVEMVELLLLHGATPGKDEIEAAIDQDRRHVSRLLEEASNELGSGF